MFLNPMQKLSIVMAHTTCEMTWLKNLLLEFSFRHLGFMLMFCDNQSDIYIARS